MRLRRTLVAGCSVLVLSCVTPLLGATRVFNFDGPEYGTADANCINNQLPPLIGRPENGSQSAMYVADPSGCGNGTLNGNVGSDALLTAFFSASSPNSEELRFSWGIAVREANWTDATKVITRTGAFTHYTYAAGDKLKITAGTGITVASYDIVSKDSDDAITLATDINAAGGDIADNTVIGEIVSTNVSPIPSDPTNDDAWIRSYTGSSVVFPAPTIHIKAGSSVSAKISCYGTVGLPTEAESTDGALEFSLIITETGVNVPLGESGGTAGTREFVGVSGKGGAHDPNTPNGGTRIPHSSSGQFYEVKWTFVDDDNNDIVEAVDVSIDGGSPVRKGIASFTGDGFLSASLNRAALDGFAIKKPADDDVTSRWFVNIDDITIDAPGVTDPVKVNGPIIEGSPRDVTVSFIDPAASEVRLYKNAVLLASATPAFTTATTHTFTGLSFVAGDVLTATQVVASVEGDPSSPVTVTGRVIFSENFDSLLQPLTAPNNGLHDLTDAGNVVQWFATSNQTTLFITLNQLLAGSCPKSVLEVATSTGSPSRILKFLGAEYDGSDANPLALTVWVNGGTGGGARNVFELRGYAGTPTNLGGATGQNQQVAMGMHNTIGGIGLTNYLGRQAFGTSPPGYYALPNAPRVANTWLKMTIKVRTSQVDHIILYPSGTEITNTFTRTSLNTFDTINIGSGLSNGSVPLYYDNITLSVGDPPVDAFATPVDAPSGVQFPLVAGATSVTVTGVNLAAQQVFVYANNTQIGQAPGNGTNTVIVPVAPALVKGQQISVGQLLAGSNPCTPSSFAAVVGDGNGPIKMTLCVRDKSGLSGPLGGNGAAGVDLEWVGNTGLVSGAPQGKPLTPSASWQTVEYRVATGSGDDPISNALASGTGVIDKVTTQGDGSKWGVLEGLHVAIDTTSPNTGPYVLYLDEIRNDVHGLMAGFENSENALWVPLAAQPIFGFPKSSGSSDVNLQVAPNISQISDERADVGTQSCKMSWQFVDETPQRWVRLTTAFTAVDLDNPMFDFTKPLTVRYLLEPADQCPADPNKTVPGVCGCGVPDTDTDGDGVADCVDNCPSTPNPGQEDANNNNIGDACETPRSIVAWRTVRNHSGLGPIALTLNATASGNGVSGPTVETRGSTNLAVGTGIQKIQVQFDGGIQLANAANISVVGRTTVSGVMGAPSNYIPASVAVVGGNTLELNFNVGQLPDESCYAITIGAGTTVELLSGDLDCNIRSLLADVNMDGQVVLGDSLATKARVNQLASAVPQFDANLSGGQINLGDALFVKTRVSSNVRRALCP